MPKSRILQLLKFMRVFGAWPGLRLWIALWIQITFASDPIRLRVPGIASDLHLRRRDLPIFWQILVMRENDFSSFAQSGRIKRTYAATISAGKKPVIIDCGSHVGLSAVWFASLFPGAVVYCVEPNDANFKLLQQNTEPFTDILCLHGGVWSRSCQLRIINPNAGSASFRLMEAPLQSAESGLLRGYTVEEIVRLQKDGLLLLVKMDIEGGESAVFQGKTEWFDAVPMMIIELHDWLMPEAGTSRSFFRRLGESNFDVVLQGENLLLFRHSEESLPATSSRRDEMGASVV